VFSIIVAVLFATRICSNSVHCLPKILFLFKKPQKNTWVVFLEKKRVFSTLVQMFLELNLVAEKPRCISNE